MSLKKKDDSPLWKVFWWRNTEGVGRMLEEIPLVEECIIIRRLCCLNWFNSEVVLQVGIGGRGLVFGMIGGGEEQL